MQGSDSHAKGCPSNRSSASGTHSSGSPCSARPGPLTSAAGAPFPPHNKATLRLCGCRWPLQAALPCPARLGGSCPGISSLQQQPLPTLGRSLGPPSPGPLLPLLPLGACSHFLWLSPDALLGTEITMVTGNDVDCGPQLSYTLVLDSRAAETFGILRYGGHIVLRGPLDYEQHSRYTLTVRASDSQHETEANVTVLVEDVNDNPPVFSQALYQVPQPLPPSLPLAGQRAAPTTVECHGSRAGQGTGGRHWSQPSLCRCACQPVRGKGASGSNSSHEPCQGCCAAQGEVLPGTCLQARSCCQDTSAVSRIHPPTQFAHETPPRWPERPRG